MRSSKDTYEMASVVYWYRYRDKLQKPEETILRILQRDLHDWRMLDVGVGGGRTTVHFADLVREYVGVDYAEAMIRVCNERFPKRSHVTFRVADAAHLESYEDESFDFVLFSANGIDAVDHETRLRILNEIRRVLKPGGVFAFSSHNLQAIPRLYKVHFAHSVKDTIYEIIRPIVLLLLYGFPKKFANKNWVVINDGTHRFQLLNYYIAPEFQLEQLGDAQFKDVRMFSLDTGGEITAKDFRTLRDNWIYYLCRK